MNYRIASTFAAFYVLVLQHMAYAGYLLGDAGPECWQTDLTTKIQLYMSSGCPSSIGLVWSDPGPATLVANEPVFLTYMLSTTLVAVPDANHNQIRHANFHSCRTSLGACVPNVAVTSGLVTQNEVMHGNFTNGKHIFSESLSLDTGAWTVIAHARFLTNTTQYDVAIGSRKDVGPPVILLSIIHNARVGMTFLPVISCLLCLAILSVLIINRDRKVIRYSTASFCMIMIVGCALGSTSAIPFNDVTPASCVLRPVMLMISFTMTFVPLILKTYRVYRIFSARILSPVRITDAILSYMLLGFVFVDCIILACWIGIAAARPVPMLLSSPGLYTFEYHCSSQYNTQFITGVVVYKGIILLIGLCLAYLTRKVPSLFNESRHIAQVFYVIAVVVATGYLLVTLIEGQPVVILAIQTIVICLVSVMTACQVFLPKFYLLYTVADKDIRGFDEPSESTVKFKPSVRRKRDTVSKSSTTISSADSATILSMLKWDARLDEKEVNSFVVNGVLPEYLISTLSYIKDEADRLQVKGGSGFRVIPKDFSEIEGYIKTLQDILSHLDLKEATNV